MSQKETVGTSSEMKPPATSVMQPRPSAAPLPRTPWMSRVLHRQPLMNMPPYYHMIHVPSPLAIVNTQSMFMSPPPNMPHHGGDGAVSGCGIPGCQARATLPACRACEESAEKVKATASSSATSSSATSAASASGDKLMITLRRQEVLHLSRYPLTAPKDIAFVPERTSGPITHDVAFLKFQKNAQLHGIKITSTKEPRDESESPNGGRLSVASPEFTPHGVYMGSDKKLALHGSLRPDVIVISSDEDEDNKNMEDAIKHLKDLKDDDSLELQAIGVPLTVNGADDCVDYSESFLSPELEEVEDLASPFASDMQLHSDGDVFCIDGAMYRKQREMVTTCTQTEPEVVEDVCPPPEVTDNWTSTEDLTIVFDKETNTAPPAAVADAAVAASFTDTDVLRRSQSANEKPEVSANASWCCCLKVPSLNTIDDSSSDGEETDMSRGVQFPEIAVPADANSSASDAVLLLVKQERPDNVVAHQLRDNANGKQHEELNRPRISKTNSLISNTSSSIVHEERSDCLLEQRVVPEQRAVSVELVDRWEMAEKFKTNSIASSTSSMSVRKEPQHDGMDPHPPSVLIDECRRRNAAAVDAVCEMFETDKVPSDADTATDSATKVGNYLNALSELNIKCPEVSQSRGPDDYPRRLDSVRPVSAFREDQVLGGPASSATQLLKIPAFDERNDLSNVLSRSGRSSINDNYSLDDHLRRQRTGPSSIHSNASTIGHQRNRSGAGSRNIGHDEMPGSSFLQEAISNSKIGSTKGRGSGRSNASRSDSDAFRKAYNACLGNLDSRESYGNLLDDDDDCRRNVMALADDDDDDDESLSGSENMSVVMSMSGAGAKSDCSRMLSSMSQMGLAEPTEMLDMIKTQLLMCDPTLATNPQMLETLAVQQLCLMHQEQMVLSQMMEAMRQRQQQHQPQQMLLLPQQQVMSPQQLLLQQQQQQLMAQQQHLVAQQQLAQQQQQQHLLPQQPFVMLPPRPSQPQSTLAPRFAARMPSPGKSCTDTNVHSSMPVNSHLDAFANSTAFHTGSFADDSEPQRKSSLGYDFDSEPQKKSSLGYDFNSEAQKKSSLGYDFNSEPQKKSSLGYDFNSEPQKKSSLGYDFNDGRVELGTTTVKNHESVNKATDYKPHEKSYNSTNKCLLDELDSSNSLAGNRLSTASPASQGKRASSISSKAASTFRPNGERRSEVPVAAPAPPSRSAAVTQKWDSSSSASRSGDCNKQPLGSSDRKAADVCGDKKSSFFISIGGDAEFAPTVPVRHAAKPAFPSAKTELPASAAAESMTTDQSFRGRGGSGAGGGGGVRPKSVANIDSVGNGSSSADSCSKGLRSQAQSQDSVNFNKGEYGKEKLPEFKRKAEGGGRPPITRGGPATDQFAMGEDCTKNRKVPVQEKGAGGVRSRWPEGPYRRTTTHMQTSDEDWGEAGSATWIKDPVHYGPPKCSQASRVKPKSEEW